MKLGIAGPIQIGAYTKYLDNLSLSGFPTPSGLGGTPVVQLTLALLERGYSLVIFTLDHLVKDEMVLEGPNLKICIGPYRLKRKARDFFRVERAYLKEAIRREKPDLVHAHWTYEFALGALASGIPTIVTAHDAPLRVLRFMCSPYFFMRTLMSLSVAQRAQYLTAVSPYVAEHFRRQLGYRRPIRVIPNGIGNDLFEMGKKRAVERVGVLTFATVLNGWGRLKNGQVALEAFKKVHMAIPQTRLLMFGIGHGEGEQASIWARQRGLDNGVEFIGELPHGELLRRLICEVDILVHPSLEEACPMAIAEAMAMGLPVIGGSYSAGVPFILENGKAGMLTDVRSPESVAQAMFCLVYDTGLCSTLGRLARESAKQRFHIEKVVGAYMAAYNEVLAGLKG